MKIAMPTWQGRISPVMDAATRLLVIEHDGGGEVGRIEEAIGEEFLPQRAKYLADLGIDVLICGGISRPLFSLITAQGITVIPWVTGPIEQILAAYHGHRLHRGQFAMPGCGRFGQHRGWGGGGGWRAGNGAGYGQGHGKGRRHKGFNREREMLQ